MTYKTYSRTEWFAYRVRAHLRWAREQGIGRLIEEDDLNPLRRARISSRKRAFAAAHHIAPYAMPVFVVGLQRSGTNMIVRGFEESPAFEVHNENDQRVFDRFRLKGLPEVRQVVGSSDHEFVLMKPLCDSHRTNELLDDLGSPTPGKALWIYRDVDSRARSALAKFGSANREALLAIAVGNDAGMWQSGGVDDATRGVIRDHVDESITPESAAALFWWVRNSLYFAQGLDSRSDVMLLSYERVIADPAASIRRACNFLGVAYGAQLHNHVAARGVANPEPLTIDPRIRALCDGLDHRLRSHEAGTSPP